MAEAATEREMQSDIEYLTKLWNDLNARARDVPAPALLYQDLNLAQRVLRDMATEETSRVVVDSRETFTKMLEFAREYTPALIERIAARSATRPGTELGIGDDAALISVGGRAVVTHDMLVEAVHFRRSTTGLRDLGHKALAVNLSDVAAMGAKPLAASSMLALSRSIQLLKKSVSRCSNRS